MDNRQSKTKSFVKSTVKFLVGMVILSVMAFTVIAMYLVVM